MQPASLDKLVLQAWPSHTACSIPIQCFDPSKFQAHKPDDSVQLSLAIPFYGTINSLFSAISIGLTAFVLPTLAFNWHYRTEERRRNCPVQPPWYAF